MRFGVSIYSYDGGRLALWMKFVPVDTLVSGIQSAIDPYREADNREKIYYEQDSEGFWGRGA